MLCIVAVGFIWAVFYALVWQPTTNEIEALEANVRYLEQAVERQKEKVAELDTNRQKGVSSQALQEVIMSSRIQTVRPRKEVMEIAERFGLPLVFWMPNSRGNGSDSEGRFLSMRGRFEGGYHRIAQCFAAILELPWVVDVDHIRLRMLNDVSRGEDVLTADFQLLSLVPSPLLGSSHNTQNHM